MIIYISNGKQFYLFTVKPSDRIADLSQHIQVKSYNYIYAQSLFKLDIRDLYFFSSNDSIAINKPIISQCTEGEILHMRQFYTYKIVWEGNQNDFRFYTNIDYQIFLNRLLSFLHIPKENSKEYKLRIGKHDLLTSYRFPINGISEKIYLLSVKST